MIHGVLSTFLHRLLCSCVLFPGTDIISNRVSFHRKCVDTAEELSFSHARSLSPPTQGHALGVIASRAEACDRPTRMLALIS